MKHTPILFLGLLSLFLLSSANEVPADPAGKGSDQLKVPAGYALAWQDEFNGDAIDKSNWSWAVGGGGFGNNEMQFYTNSPDNSRVENGTLVIEARKQRKAGWPYTSAKLVTLGRKEMLYGRIEVKAKLPRGVGSWPGIWMLPVDGRGHGLGWPDSGEIDIMEHVGFDQGRVHSTIHTGAYNHKIGTHKAGSIMVPDAAEAFHVYAVDWKPDSLTFTTDGETVFRFEKTDDDWMKWPFDKPFYLILNLACGGDWGGSQGVDNESFPWRMEIDWIRVFRPL